MGEESTQRRLAAILIADVAGDGRMLEAQQKDARARLGSGRNQAIDPKAASEAGALYNGARPNILLFADTPA